MYISKTAFCHIMEVLGRGVQSTLNNHERWNFTFSLQLTKLPPSHKIEKITEKWKVGARVAKWRLRPEVQEFCGQFPVYRLEPFTPDSVTVMSEDDDTSVGKPQFNVTLLSDKGFFFTGHIRSVIKTQIRRCWTITTSKLCLELTASGKSILQDHLSTLNLNHLQAKFCIFDFLTAF